ncbi:MAG: RNA polymerase sigma factor [Clostridia bacterium]|nr:RNA polymerase sigma factor [Clostridia bacterium]MBT7123233.1 RNA polymerase sigma factor [Clostridia bacterium]
MIGQVFEENYEWFKRFLRGRFINLNDYDIEDIIQQAAMNLLYKTDIAGISNLTSYVYTSIANGAKDHFKKRNRETLVDESLEEETQALEEKVLVGELKQVIMDAIEQLEPKQRFVFVETEMKGRSYDELVQETGEKLGTLLSRKNRAIKKLRKMIEEYINEEKNNEKI